LELLTKICIKPFLGVENFGSIEMMGSCIVGVDNDGNMGYVVGSNFGSSFGIEVDNIIGN
jgi:hypothetical protein